MIQEHHIINIQRFGYAESEARFLCLVALHGGYFVRRQFDSWTGAQRGKRSDEFVAHLLKRRHCRRHVFEHNRQVFHLHFRPFYSAIGDENSRNRREHQSQAIKARLMALDFVLTHPENRYFATETEKVEHLCGERRIAHEHLPAKLFGSTRRYFLDRFPMFMRPGALEVVFCYIDSGFETSAAFVTHLRHYLPLFGELPSFELVYVGTASTRYGEAQNIFERLLSHGHTWLSKATDTDRLLEHFRDRLLFEQRQTSSFDRVRLDRLRDDMDTFSGPQFADMFNRWKTLGDHTIRAELASHKMPKGRFSKVLLPHDYDIFGRIQVAS